MTFRYAFLVTSVSFARTVHGSGVFFGDDADIFNPYGLVGSVDSALLQQGVALLASAALQNRTEPLSVRLDRDLNVVLDKNTAVLSSAGVVLPDQDKSITNSSFLAKTIRHWRSRTDLSLHAAARKLEQAGQHLIAQLVDNTGHKWDSFARHLVPPPGVTPDVEAAMEDASELAYQLSTIESVVKQANDEFVHSQLSALLQTAGTNDTAVLYGSLDDILGSGSPARISGEDVTENDLNADIVYNGKFSNPAVLTTVPRSMDTKSMFSIYRDLLDNVNHAWLSKPENNAYMDSYLNGMDSTGKNQELNMTDNGDNWYSNEMTTDLAAIRKTYDALDIGQSSVNGPASVLLQSLSVVGMLPPQDPRVVAVSLAQGLAVHSEFSHLRDSVQAVGNIFREMGTEGTSRVALSLYDKLLHQSRSAISSLEHVCLMAFKTHDLPTPQPAF